MNKLLIKLTAVILVGLLLVIGALCLIGFLIGGRLTWLHFALFAACSLLYGAAAGYVLLGDEKEKRTTAIVVAFLLFFGLFWSGYGCLNTLSRSNDFLEYQSTVTYIDLPARQLLFETVYFTDSEGQEAHKTVLQALNTENYYDDGVAITVKEYQGGFGYPTYEITLTENNNESQ